MKELQKNKWKYSTIGLLAILAIGFSFPQAFAHITNSLSHNAGHILETIGSMQSDLMEISTTVSKIEEKLDTGNFAQIEVVMAGGHAVIPAGLVSGSDLVVTIPAEQEGILERTDCGPPEMTGLVVPSTQSFQLIKPSGVIAEIFCADDENISLGGGDRIVFECELSNPAVRTTICVRGVTLWLKLMNTATS